MNGRPLAINWADDNIPSIVEAWQLGTQSGNAISQVLYGDYNPSGKLPMTFPKNVGQVPIYYNHKNTGRPTLPGPNQVFWSHYQDVSNEPLYEFGYGLSYSEFKYENLKVQVDSDNQVSVTVEVTNTSKVTGKEVVQLYIRDISASVTRPIKELKGFELTEFDPGETKTISFSLTENELGFYNNKGEWLVESGDFKVFVGGSSKTSLEADFEIQ